MCISVIFLPPWNSFNPSSKFCKGVSKHTFPFCTECLLAAQKSVSCTKYVLSHLFTSLSVYPTAGKPVLDFYIFISIDLQSRNPPPMPVANDIKGKMGGLCGLLLPPKSRSSLKLPRVYLPSGRTLKTCVTELSVYMQLLASVCGSDKVLPNLPGPLFLYLNPEQTLILHHYSL